jgi:addiction module HigA family antidote
LVDYLDYHWENIMRMHSPPHPGEILKEDVLPELGLTVGQFAAHLGISRPRLSKVLNGRAGITAEMDLKLSEALGQIPGLWLRMQGAHDLWWAEQSQRQRDAPLRVAA